MIENEGEKAQGINNVLRENDAAVLCAVCGLGQERSDSGSEMLLQPEGALLALHCTARKVCRIGLRYRMRA